MTKPKPKAVTAKFLRKLADDFERGMYISARRGAVILRILRQEADRIGRRRGKPK